MWRNDQQINGLSLVADLRSNWYRKTDDMVTVYINVYSSAEEDPELIIQIW